jgi:hypothetical protein
VSEQRSDLAIELQPDPDTDSEELAELAFRLRSELLDLDVEAIELANAGAAPADAKGFGLLQIGGLVVQFVLRPDVLHGLVSGVESWLGRQRIHSVKITLNGDSCEVTGVSSTEQSRLIDAWIARHAGPG